MLGLFKKKTTPTPAAPPVEPPKERRVDEAGNTVEKHMLPEFGEVWVVVDGAEAAQ